jgi:hypothetical protein
MAAKHFALTAPLIQLSLGPEREAPNVSSSTSRTSATKWMTAAFETPTTDFSERCNRWILDDKWVEIIRSNRVDEPSKEKELKFDRRRMVNAVASRWKHATDDFTTTKNAVAKT